MCNKKQGIHKDICEMFLGRGANVMSGKSGAAKPSTRDFLSRPAPPVHYIRITAYCNGFNKCQDPTFRQRRWW